MNKMRFGCGTNYFFSFLLKPKKGCFISKIKLYLCATF